MQGMAGDAQGPNSLHLISNSISSSGTQCFPGKTLGSGRAWAGVGLCLLWHGRGQLLGQIKAGVVGIGASHGGRDTPQRKRFLSFFLEAVPVTHGPGSLAAHP